MKSVESRWIKGVAVALLLMLQLLPAAPAMADTPGSVWAWGYNYHGDLGNGTETDSAAPIPVTGLTGTVAIAAGVNHSLAVKSDGTVWTWGDGGYGQLGNGIPGGYSSTPVPVTGLTGAVAIAGGANHSLAVKSDGTVWAWGYNWYGQFGNGTNTNSATPVQVTGLTGAVAIAGGDHHSLALKSDGTVWAWGYNHWGQLGNGTTTDTNTPVQVTGLTGVTAVAAASWQSLALKSDGTVWAWGWNNYGQLGNGTTTDSSTPVQVTGLTGATAIAMGYGHGIALKSGGTVWEWGYNGFSYLGATPVQVTGLTGAMAITTGSVHSLAVKSDGTVWAWGRNDYGQLGSGTTTDSNTPVQVTGLTAATAVAAGNRYSLVLSTLSSASWPAVTTSDADNITTTSARLNGSLDSPGTASTVNVSFLWGTTSAGYYANETSPVTMTATGTFNAGLTGLLNPGTTYYFRAKAVGNGTIYGPEKSFTASVVPAGKRLINLPGGLKAWKEDDPGIDLAEVGQTADTAAVIGPLVGSKKIPVVRFSLVLSQATADIDFAGQLTVDVDLVNGKAVSHRSSYPSGIAPYKKLYVKKLPQHNSVRVVPGARTLAEVYPGATGSYVLTLANVDLKVITTADGEDFWEISGITGTGAMGETTEAPASTPASSPATSTSGARSMPDPSSYVMVGSGLAAALLYAGISRLRRRLNRSR